MAVTSRPVASRARIAASRPAPGRPRRALPPPPSPLWEDARASLVSPAFPAWSRPLGLCHRLLPSGHRLALAAPRTRVRARALATDRQVAPVSKTAVAADLLETLDVQRDLASQIAFHRVTAID